MRNRHHPLPRSARRLDVARVLLRGEGRRDLARSSIFSGLAALLLAFLAVSAAARSPGADCPTGPEGTAAWARRRAGCAPPSACRPSPSSRRRHPGPPHHPDARRRSVAALSFTRRAGEAPRVSLSIRMPDEVKTIEQPVPLAIWERCSIGPIRSSKIDGGAPSTVIRSMRRRSWRACTARRPASIPGPISSRSRTRAGPASPAPAAPPATAAPPRSQPPPIPVPHPSGAGAVRALHEPLRRPPLDRTKPARGLARLDGDREAGVGIANAVWSLVRSRENALRRSHPAYRLRARDRASARGAAGVSGREAVPASGSAFSPMIATSLFPITPSRDGAIAASSAASLYHRDLHRHDRLRFVNAPLTARFVAIATGAFASTGSRSRVRTAAARTQILIGRQRAFPPLRHQKLRHGQEGAGLARRARPRLRFPRLQDRRDRRGAARRLDRRVRLGEGAEPRRHHLPQAARGRQGRAGRGQGGSADAGPALDDQAPDPRSGDRRLLGFGRPPGRRPLPDKAKSPSRAP